MQVCKSGGLQSLLASQSIPLHMSLGGALHIHLCWIAAQYILPTHQFCCSLVVTLFHWSSRLPYGGARVFAYMEVSPSLCMGTKETTEQKATTRHCKQCSDGAQRMVAPYLPCSKILELRARSNLGMRSTFHNYRTVLMTSHNELSLELRSSKGEAVAFCSVLRKIMADPS